MDHIAEFAKTLGVRKKDIMKQPVPEHQDAGMVQAQIALIHGLKAIRGNPRTINEYNQMQNALNSISAMIEADSKAYDNRSKT